METVLLASLAGAMRCFARLATLLSIVCVLQVWVGSQAEEDDYEDVDPASIPEEDNSTEVDSYDPENIMDEAEEAGEEEEEEEEEESVWADEQLSEQHLQGLHDKIDANGDGKMSMDELLAFQKVSKHAISAREASEEFNEVDHDQDGKISLQELLEHTLGPPDEEGIAPPERSDEEVASNERIKLVETAKFKAADANADGFLSKEELASVFTPENHDEVMTLIATHALQAKDANKDGELDSDEFWENEEQDDQHVDEHMQVQKADFESLDKDKNGKINVEEFKHWESGVHESTKAMREFFEVADEDHDGFVTAKELLHSRMHLGNHAAVPHLQEWVEHYEL